MNIVYLHAHDMGRINSAYGFAMPTPNIRRFAEEGVLFRQAFCAAPTCSPSRAALLTGRSAHQTGVLGLIHRGFRLSNPEHHMARYFSEQGYETFLSGVQHEVPFDEKGRLYDEVFAPAADCVSGERERDIVQAGGVVEFLRRPHQKPFFVSFGTHFPHRRFADGAARGFSPANAAPLFNLPDCPEVRRDVADYQASVSIADEAFGLILDAIRETGLRDRTLIFLTTDHGVAFPGAKCTLKDAGIGVTLAFQIPGLPTGGVQDGLVSHLDVFPTLCDFAGLKLPDWLEGYSLRPILEESSAQVREEVFAEVNFHASYEPMRCVRTERYKLIRFFDQDVRPRLANVDEGPTKDFLMKNELLADHAETELYDLWNDPQEQINLASLPAFHPLLQKLTLKLQLWMEKTADPLLQGRIPVPPGARINRVDCENAKTPEYVSET